jgi:hypothetical protein
MPAEVFAVPFGRPQGDLRQQPHPYPDINALNRRVQTASFDRVGGELYAQS